MKLRTANNMVRALEPYRQYLFINEWEKVKEVIYYYVDDERPEPKGNGTASRQEETPPLVAAWEWGWNKKLSASVWVYIGIFVLGVVIGYAL